ncbi:12295_t:CDS:2 [Acaulospora morrowiae]|uniref:12295_t:CDS:1 n=1 Tax=Acaulospora morrowiae TaxID=94023 RepID=A0A9N9G159_9GLOM|nr:12295_t:CDS:2 [Acaulospora morrowiae]
MSIDSSNPLIRTFWLGKSVQTLENGNEDSDILVNESWNLWGDAINANDFFCEYGFLRPKAICNLFDKKCYSFDTAEAEPFTKAATEIHILARNAAIFLDSRISTRDNLYKEEKLWSGQGVVLEEIFNLYIEQDFYTALLLGTSTLEKVLRDIHAIDKDVSIPNLIRDLLISPPLVRLLGEDIVFFLRCLIGPPSSINLRNVLWHGFISPKEFLPVPAKWYSALITITIVTVCYKVRRDGGMDSLNKRCGTDFGRFFHLDSPPDFNGGDSDGGKDADVDFDVIYESIMYEQAIPPRFPHCSLLKNLLLRNFFILPCTQSSWERSLYFLSRNRLLLFLTLTLPLFEHCLRRIFVCVNKGVQEHRMNTVEVEGYFLTLDILLEKNVDWIYYGINADDKNIDEMPENLIYEELDGGTMDLILDLFIHADGPRLRNRVAHGEANHLISSLVSSNPLYSYYVSLLIVLWIKYHTKLLLIKSMELQEDEIESSRNEDFQNDVNIEDSFGIYERWTSTYQSRFHPVPMLWKESLHLIIGIWKCWTIAKMIEKTGRFVLGDWIEFVSSDHFTTAFNDDMTYKDIEFENLSDIATDFKILPESLFLRRFLKEVIKENSIVNIVRMFGEKIKTRRFKNTDDTKKPIFWCQRRFTKEDAKLVNFQRVVVGKADSGVEKIIDVTFLKLQEILKSIHTSPSLSSRKRKNIQSLFSLFPTIMLKLYFAIFTLEYSVILEQHNLSTTANQQKLMLAVLVFVERWSGYCIEGKWKEISEAFEEMRRRCV